jgi:TRAP-type C4-dicarboxylate transport system substrate-binding protein
MRPTTINFAAFAAVAILALAAVGCDSGDGTDKAGGSGNPVTLRLATPDRPGLPGARAIEHFRDEVAEASDGSVRITPVYEAAGKGPRFDQAVADLVRSGRMEMALIPARAWDEYGVTSLSALQAPFLIRDQAALNEVVTGELAAPMMQGLRRTGVTGLALLPENLRHPFAFSGALRTPRDFAGAEIRAPLSEATFALLRALGAEPVDLEGDELKQAINDGSVVAAESAFDLAGPTLPRIGTGTSNITFFPKVNVLVANSAALRDLPESARTALDAAAANTLDWVTRTNRDDRDAALSYCREGGRVVAARPADIERLVEASRPVYTDLERDAVTKRFIERVRALVQDERPATAQAVTCEPSGATASDQGGTESHTDPDVLDGVYRNRVTVDDYLTVGVTEAEAIENQGVHTITLDGGHLRDTLVSPSNPNSDIPCSATYRVSGHTFIFKWDPYADCSGDFTATWRLSGGELRFTNIRTEERLDEVQWGVRPFRKIG